MADLVEGDLVGVEAGLVVEEDSAAVISEVVVSAEEASAAVISEAEGQGCSFLPAVRVASVWAGSVREG
jgi:hypothetical protein